jgi:hypothetical protein
MLLLLLFLLLAAASKAHTMHACCARPRQRFLVVKGREQITDTCVLLAFAVCKHAYGCTDTDDAERANIHPPTSLLATKECMYVQMPSVAVCVSWTDPACRLFFCGSSGAPASERPSCGGGWWASAAARVIAQSNIPYEVNYPYSYATGSCTLRSPTETRAGGAFTWVTYTDLNQVSGT